MNSKEKKVTKQPSDIACTVGNTIRKLRVMKDISRKELAKTVGVTPMTIFRVEKGIAMPRFAHLPTYAKALGVPVCALFLDRSDDSSLSLSLDNAIRDLPQDIRSSVLNMLGAIVKHMNPGALNVADAGTDAEADPVAEPIEEEISEAEPDPTPKVRKPRGRKPKAAKEDEAPVKKTRAAK